MYLFCNLRRSFFTVFLILALVASGGLMTVAKAAESVALSWDSNPEPDIAGYRVRFGQTRGTLAEIADTGSPVTELTLSGLTPGETYYFAVLAYNQMGVEGPLSAEISYLVPLPVEDPPVPATEVPELAVESSAGGFLSPPQAFLAVEDTQVGSTFVVGTITLHNRGRAALSGLALSLSGTGAAAYPCSELPTTTLASGAATTFVVSFSPSAVGQHLATLRISSNDPTHPQLEIALTGQATAATAASIAVFQAPETPLILGATVAFGDLELGTPAGRIPLTIRNVGTASLNGLHATISGPGSARFTHSPVSMTTLAPGASTTFEITFHPTAEGPASATLILAGDNAATAEFSLTANAITYPGIVLTGDSHALLTATGRPLNFGSHNLAAKRQRRTITLKNTGSAPLTDLKFTCTGAAATDFKLVAPKSTSLAPGKSVSISIYFSPSAAGARMATVRLASNASGPPREFTLAGTGVAVPEIEVRLGARNLRNGKASVGFGRGQIGKIGSSQTLIITNVGSATLKNFKVSTNGISPEEFSMTKIRGRKLAAGKSARLKVTFRARKGGIRWSAIRITSNDDDESNFEIILTGTGTTAKVAIKKKRKKPGNSNAAPLALASSATDVSPEKAITVITGRKFRTLTISRAPGVPISANDIQVSSDCVEWASGKRHTTVLRDDAKLLVVRDNSPVSQDHKRFIRLKR